MNQEIEYRGYRIVQMSHEDMAPILRCTPAEAAHRLSINGMSFCHVYVVLDEFDEVCTHSTWFEAPLTAKAAIDIQMFGEGFQRTFWPSYHDVYIAMRNTPQILRAFQQLHRESVALCEDGLLPQDDFAYTVRERLARLFTDMEFNLNANAKGGTNGTA